MVDDEIIVNKDFMHYLSELEPLPKAMGSDSLVFPILSEHSNGDLGLQGATVKVQFDF